MAPSHWNQYLERKLAAKLNGSESRLLDAIARLTLGYRRASTAVGDRQLQELAHIDRRNLVRTRRGLIDADLILYTPGRPGRGGVRGSYLLKLDTPNSVNSRALKDESNSVSSRALDAESNSVKLTSKSASGDAHLKVTKGKDTGGVSAQHTHGDSVKNRATNQELVGRVVESYSAQGGSLERPDWRAMLARHATQLLGGGTPADLIVTAAGVLAREPDAYPGNLTKLVKRIQAEGMPCKHRGDLRGLSKALLLECGCPGCLDRIAYCEAHGLDTAFLEPLKAA